MRSVLLRARSAVGFRGGCLLLASLTVLFACSKVEVVGELRRGRLRCTELVERRRVNNYWWEVFVDDRPFIPDNRETNKVGQCQASRNPNVKALVLLLGDNCWTLRLDGDKPVFTRIEAGGNGFNRAVQKRPLDL